MSLSGFEISAYTFAGFMLAYGVLFLFVSFKINREAGQGGTERETGKKAVMNTKVIVFLFALLYFALSHITIYAALDYNIEYGLTPNCEMIPNSSTTTGSTTTYTLINSCAGMTAPEAQVQLFHGYGWVLYLDLAALMFGSILLMITSFIRRW